MQLKQDITIALRMIGVSLVLTGIIYPASVTLFAQILMPKAANGSLLHDQHGTVIGSKLIGQNFHSDTYFWGRPTAIANNDQHILVSSGSNLGPTSAKLHTRKQDDRQRLQQNNPAPVPEELLTTSASGLDPDMPLQAVLWQIPRVAKARGITEEVLQKFLEEYAQAAALVNILQLNQALHQRF